MASSETVADAPSDSRRSAIAVGTLFFVNGMTFSNWLPRIPEVRDKLGIDNGGLGTALLGGGLGGLIGSLLVARVLARYRTKTVLIVAATCSSLILPLIGFVPSALALTLVLTALGFSDLMADMSMNAQGVTVERRLGRSIINRLHGTWSLGFMVGALLGLGASAINLGIRTHLIIVAAILLVTMYSISGRLLSVDEPHETEAAGGGSRLSLLVIAMAVMAIGVGWVEIVPGDWSSVMFRDLFDAGRWSGLGTVTFAGAMLTGRMGGDYVLDRIGPKRLLSLAITLGIAGAVVLVSAQGAALAIVGLVLWGLGISVMFPQLYATAATLKGVSAGAGLGAMGVGQRLGFMLAPVIVGAVADWQTLRFAIGAVVAVAFITIIATRTLVERSVTP
jgi:MFS family permease